MLEFYMLQQASLAAATIGMRMGFCGSALLQAADSYEGMKSEVWDK
jgi:hypothetical protein